MDVHLRVGCGSSQGGQPGGAGLRVGPGSPAWVPASFTDAAHDLRESLFSSTFLYFP